MALDDAPSVEVEIKDVGGGGDTPAAADTSVPSPSESSAEAPAAAPADDGTPALDTSSPQPAEDTGREADGNKDMNLEVIKANAEPKTNHGMVAAAQQVQESQAEQREAKKDEEKEFEETLERARDSEKQATARAIKEKEELEQITTMRAALDDKKTREALIRVLMERENITREEAEKRTSDLQRRLELEEMEKKGQKLSEKQREELERLKKQTEADKTLFAQKQKDGSIAEMTKDDISRNTAKQQESTSKREDDYAADNADPSVPSSKVAFGSAAAPAIKTDTKLSEDFKASVVAQAPANTSQKPQVGMAIQAPAAAGLG